MKDLFWTILAVILEFLFGDWPDPNKDLKEIAERKHDEIGYWNSHLT